MQKLETSSVLCSPNLIAIAWPNFALLRFQLQLRTFTRRQPSAVSLGATTQSTHPPNNCFVGQAGTSALSRSSLKIHIILHNKLNAECSKLQPAWRSPLSSYRCLCAVCCVLCAYCSYQINAKHSTLLHFHSAWVRRYAFTVAFGPLWPTNNTKKWPRKKWRNKT